MNEAPPIDYPLHRRQGVAFSSEANEILYGGAAGGGKSYLMRVAAIYWCMANAGLQVYLFRRLRPDLWMNHMQGSNSFPDLLARLIKDGYCRIVGGIIKFFNGSAIYLRHLQYDKTLNTYQGAEIHVLLIDEATHFTDEQYRYLRARVRLGSYVPPNPGFPRILLSANPGGVGHHWVKKTFVDQGEFNLMKTDEEEGGMLRQFIPARSADNPTLLKNDPTYIKRLAGLGDVVLVRALMDGDWDVVAGAMFGLVWKRARHTCPPFPIPRDWRIWRGMDDGYSCPASIHWVTRNPITGTYYVIAELYREKMMPGEVYERVYKIEHSLEIKHPDGSTELNKTALTGQLDSASFADTGQGEISRGAQMNAKGMNWKAVEKWAGSRVQRCQNMHRLLGVNEKCPDGKPGIIFFDTCKEAIRTIPALPRDKNNIEDVDTDAEDHAYDSVCYAIQDTGSGRRVRRLFGI